VKASKHETVRLKYRGPSVGALRVRVAPWRAGHAPATADISVGAVRLPCAIGRAGVTRQKREGDGATPLGQFRILSWRFQPVAPAFPRGKLSARTIRKDDGWCDDPSSGAYNRQIRLPARAGHEDLWREDGKYAVIGILDCNIRPRKRAAGSAIFFHLCDAQFGATAGCVAVRPADFRKIARLISRRTIIEIR
jgi:L,D-peptidoglycan transpeptidase YkuD (ErfK/YbiS/YcfS/YnhG family)